jgi:hypothetical protein
MQIDPNMRICLRIYVLQVSFVGKLMGVHVYTHVHMLGPPLLGRTDD